MDSELIGILNSINARLKVLEQQAGIAPSAPGAPVVPPEPAYPRMTTVRGANVMLNAPVHPKWLPDMASLVFGYPGAVVSDPSNAPPGYPNRSSGGWPLHYGGVAWNSVAQEWVGPPLGPGVITNEGRLFNSEAEAEAWSDKRMSEVPDPMWGQTTRRLG
jgi:hypothetical protein